MIDDKNKMAVKQNMRIKFSIHSYQYLIMRRISRNLHWHQKKDC